MAHAVETSRYPAGRRVVSSPAENKMEAAGTKPYGPLETSTSISLQTSLSLTIGNPLAFPNKDASWQRGRINLISFDRHLWTTPIVPVNRILAAFCTVFRYESDGCVLIN